MSKWSLIIYGLIALTDHNIPIGVWHGRTGMDGM
jgi:hypothetical protein